MLSNLDFVILIKLTFFDNLKFIISNKEGAGLFLRSLIIFDNNSKYQIWNKHYSIGIYMQFVTLF